MDTTLIINKLPVHLKIGISKKHIISHTTIVRIGLITVNLYSQKLADNINKGTMGDLIFNGF
jgi:hypothetical protein